jgi:Xaa-Pro aminopeptidase
MDSSGLRRYCLDRVQREIRAAECAAALFNDPVNVRYVTGTTNMTVWLLHNQGRYCIVPAEGKAILFEYPNKNCLRLARESEVVGEIRTACAYSYFFAGEHAAAMCTTWAKEVIDVVRGFGGNDTRLAVDRLDPLGAYALQSKGLILLDGQAIIEKARAIKSADEITCVRRAVAAADAGMARMRNVLRPGITENQLWAELHHANIALGGEWLETRLLASGSRTNPWFQECSDRVIEAGDLVSFDTDLVGPSGYCADISRTFFCGPGRPREEQRRLYAFAVEQVRHNVEILRPGMSFDELRARAWKIPSRYDDQKYGSIAHGVGLIDEWPAIAYGGSDRAVQQGIIEPGMILCIESYIGEVGGAEGVKLEEQVLFTEQGTESLSAFPIDDSLVV